MDADPILAQIDALFSEWGFGPEAIPSWEAFRESRTSEIARRTTRAMALLERFAPTSTYLRAAKEPFEKGWDSGESETFIAVAAALAAFRSDLQDGYLKTLEELIHADLFADFLEMASELQVKGFKDPAAVIAGSVLEEHSRKLAAVSGIPTAKPSGESLKASVINAELTKGGAYNKLVEKSVTAWLGLRNSAAHGEYDAYDDAQAAALIRDVRDFLVRHPA
ncbi:MAG: hypothetical protein WDZ46_03385 [Solirubrobacterales bacterium]